MWEPIALPGFDHGCSTHRQQPYHGAHFQARGAAVGKAEDIVVESILVVPHAVRTDVVHRSRDPQKMLTELHSQIFIGRVVGRNFDADLKHVLAEERHPGGAVSLFEVTAGGQRRAAVEDPDVVEAKEATLKDVLAVAVLAVDPPGKVGHKLSIGAFYELDVSLAAQRLLHSVEKDRGP